MKCPQCDGTGQIPDPDPPPKKRALCVGYNGVGEWKCCDRAGEYNGYGSGPLLFVCPQSCGCHD